MNRRNGTNLKSACALLALMVAGQGMAATIRYQGSGDYNDVLAVTGVNGWQAGGTGTDGLPGPLDTIRINWGNNVVTLTNAVTVARFQIGVDESGHLIVENGGSLTASGTSANRVGNNPTPAIVGKLTVNTNGVVNSTAVLEVGSACTGVLTIDGGTVNLSSHLWVGSTATGVGTIILTNGGTLTMLGVAGNGMIGLGTINATSASGGTGTIKVNGGGVLNLFNIDGQGRSIQPGSLLDISGDGVVTIPGDFVNVMSAYTNAGRITANGGTGTVVIDYNTINPGKTTLKATGGYVPPTEVVWNPAANPSTTGAWNESANWTGGLLPAGVTKVIFNVAGAIPCSVSNSVMASYLVMGDNGPGGKLVVTNGGILTCGSDNASVIGYNNTAMMVVENGGTVSFGYQLWVGFDSGSDGTLIMNGGTVSVANTFGLGWQGGKGTAQIKGGTLNLSLWDDSYAIQGTSVLDVSGTGKVVINGNHTSSVEYFVSLGLITANGGTGTVVVDYNTINVGKTTVYPLGQVVYPAQATWNPALNEGDLNGLWNVSTNWTGGLCPGDVTVVMFNVPDAIPCTVTNAAGARYVAMGINGGPGGKLIIANGGSLQTGTDNWSAVGYNSNALMVVENGASVSFGYHLWVGLDPGSDGTLVMNGGTVSVSGMFGLGWQGGKGTASINGGTLNLRQLHATDSIKGESLMTISGTGTVVITGDQVNALRNYISSGKIRAADGATLVYSYDSGSNTTTLQIAPPQQGVTGVTVSGGNASISYQTTAGHIYHVEGTPSLSPAAWTRVAGSTTNATGAAVTFSFPTTGEQMFYRTVSP